MATEHVSPDERRALERDLRGRVVGPGDPDYDDARAVWNGMIDRRPAVIVRCAVVADVREAVDFARERDLPVTVRGGGHNVAGTAIEDGALVVDLSAMDAVRVDPGDQTAWVQGGATWADVDRETQPFGLAAPGGVVSDTGVGGLTLGGGIGHLRRAYGLSCDNVVCFEVVTAEGALVTASPHDHPDLYWGLRGGGGGLGVVTGFEFDLHPVGPEVATALVFYRGEDRGTCLRAFREWAASAPRAVSALAFAGQLPEPELFDAEAVHEPKIAFMGCYAGLPGEGQRALAPLREFADPLADEGGVADYVEFQQALDADYPDGMRYYWKSLFLEGLSEDAVASVVARADRAPSPLSTVDVWQLGGAIADVDPGATAFPAREAPYLLGVEANWEDPAADEENVAWVRDCVDDFRAYSTGASYRNFPGFFEEAGRSGDVEASTRRRLADLDAAYDPEGLFRSGEEVARAERG